MSSEIAERIANTVADKYNGTRLRTMISEAVDQELAEVRKALEILLGDDATRDHGPGYIYSLCVKGWDVDVARGTLRTLDPAKGTKA